MPMPDLSVAATLDLWQAAEGLAPVERALVLAAAGGEETDGLSGLPLGRRDARLLALHEVLAGPLLEATATCPACGEQAEFAVDVEALLAAEPVPPAPLEASGYSVEWRSPDSRDFAAAAAAEDAAAAERVLLARCVTAARGPDGEVAGPALPAEVREALSGAIVAADPLAEVLADVACPACEATFVADLDLGGFVWAELRAQSQRLMREVDILARAYGWTEAEVLALPERRRTGYLELAREGAG
jgi:hypothetical protein